MVVLVAVLRGYRLQKKGYASVPPGTYLLDLNDLTRWNDLSLKLCQRSEEYCANLWDGEIQEDQERRALSLLTPEELEDWIRLSELANKRSPSLPSRSAVSEEDFKRGLREIRPILSNIELERLNLALHRQEQATPEEASSAMKSLLRNSHLPPDLRERFIRYLASQRLKR